MEGIKISPNLREIIQKKMSEENLVCSCIRCREIRDKKMKNPLNFQIVHYQASSGDEYFLEYVDRDNSLLGFLRLRVTKKSAIVRELHVYGFAASIGERSIKKIQHVSLGKKLLEKAEEIVKQNKLSKIAVISGVGTREYYGKLGYSLVQTYMIKSIKPVEDQVNYHVKCN